MSTGYEVPGIPRIAANATVVANAATGDVAVANFGKIHTNTGASAGIVLTLPAAASVAGCAIRFKLTVAQTITVTPQSGEKIFLDGSGTASKYLLIAPSVGNFVEMFCNGTDFLVQTYNGTVTKEA